MITITIEGSNLNEVRTQLRQYAEALGVSSSAVQPAIPPVAPAVAQPVAPAPSAPKATVEPAPAVVPAPAPATAPEPAPQASTPVQAPVAHDIMADIRQKATGDLAYRTRVMEKLAEWGKQSLTQCDPDELRILLDLDV